VFLARFSPDALGRHPHAAVQAGAIEGFGRSNHEGCRRFRAGRQGGLLLASYEPVTTVFAFYGAGWSVYSHALARGRDVTLARNSPLEIRFATDEDPSPIEAKPEWLPSEKPTLAQP